jgi:hypothetical protein
VSQEQLVGMFNSYRRANANYYQLNYHRRSHHRGDDQRHSAASCTQLLIGKNKPYFLAFMCKTTHISEGLWLRNASGD